MTLPTSPQINTLWCLTFSQVFPTHHLFNLPFTLDVFVCWFCSPQWQPAAAAPVPGVHPVRAQQLLLLHAAAPRLHRPHLVRTHLDAHAGSALGPGARSVRLGLWVPSHGICASLVPFLCKCIRGKECFAYMYQTQLRRVKDNYFDQLCLPRPTCILFTSKIMKAYVLNHIKSPVNCTGERVPLHHNWTFFATSPWYSLHLNLQTSLLITVRDSHKWQGPQAASKLLWVPGLIWQGESWVLCISVICVRILN